MKLNFSVAPIVIASFLSTQAFADTNHYAIIIDAGSSGSRLHLFQVDENKDLPVIKDIFTEKNSLPLAAFASHPEDAGASLKPLLDDVTKKIVADNINQPIPIAVLGTAGMRLLTSDEQYLIYKNVGKYIRNYYSFPIVKLNTLSGKMEGLYDWLEVNYLADNFQNNKNTVGSIDMGGASTQIAFETQDASQPNDEERLTINHKTYLVFTKSFLGLGLDQARNSMTSYPLSETCYPKNYPLNKTAGNFNFATCDSLYSQLIGKHHVAESLLPIPKDQKFIAFSGAYYVYQFFNAAKTPDETFFQSQINTVCAQSFEVLKQNYPNESEKYLAAYCANGVYLQNLFYHTYQLTGYQLQIEDSINQQSIDWTLGAVLYNIIT